MGNNGSKAEELSEDTPKRLPEIIPLESFKASKDKQFYPKKFCQKEKAWQVVKPSSNNETLTEITVVTYNVWFDDSLYPEKRYEELLKTILEGEPHVVCLQEVTKKFIDYLTHNKTMIEKYYISDSTGDFVGSYGVCILSKLRIKRLSYLLLPTQMGRNCLIAEFTINNKQLICATVHLESLHYRDYRNKQLETIADFLRNYDTAILMGDFNFDSKMNYSHHLEKLKYMRTNNVNQVSEGVIEINAETLENNQLNTHFKGYLDAWEKLKSNENGYTYDSETNTMVNKLNGYEQMRYDRILLRSDYWKPQQITLLGTNQIVSISEDTIFPSDHFGIMLKMSTNNKLSLSQRLEHNHNHAKQAHVPSSALTGPLN